MQQLIVHLDTFCVVLVWFYSSETFQTLQCGSLPDLCLASLQSDLGQRQRSGAKAELSFHAGKHVRPLGVQRAVAVSVIDSN